MTGNLKLPDRKTDDKRKREQDMTEKIEKTDRQTDTNTDRQTD